MGTLGHPWAPQRSLPSLIAGMSHDVSYPVVNVAEGLLNHCNVHRESPGRRLKFMAGNVLGCLQRLCGRNPGASTVLQTLPNTLQHRRRTAHPTFTSFHARLLKQARRIGASD